MGIPDGAVFSLIIGLGLPEVRLVDGWGRCQCDIVEKHQIHLGGYFGNRFSFPSLQGLQA